MQTNTYPRIVFIGAHVEAEAPFRWLLDSGEHVAGLVTLTPEARVAMSGAVDLAQYAKAASVPVLETKSSNSAATVEWIANLRPDILLVVGWTQLVNDALLTMPTVATLGFHASLLPKYRGRAPINWAIIHGEKETGNTMMVLAPGADEGDIVAQRSFSIDHEDTCESLYRKVSLSEIDMLRDVLAQVRKGGLPRTKQDSTNATVMPKRRPEDGWIDWTRPASKLYDWVRAQTHPYPGAFTFLATGTDVKKIWIWRAQMVPSAKISRVEPGTIARDKENWPVVATGEGWLRLLSVQIEGGEEISGDRAMGALFNEQSKFRSEHLVSR